MEPVTYKRNGRELGNAEAAGRLCRSAGRPNGVSGETYQFYIRRPRSLNAAYPPPPAHVYVDVETGQRMYPLKAVRAWNDGRPGRGNWGGEGARARLDGDQQAEEGASAERA